MTDKKLEESAEHDARNKEFRDAASETLHKAAGTAREASEIGTRAAADAASSMTDHVMGILDEQLGSGARSAIRLARSMRLAANDLAEESPVVASLVRGLSHSVDVYAGRLEDQTVEQLAKSASDFTRRQPALTFGLAAVAGFLAYRTFKNARPTESPPIAPDAGHD
jgi:hypothetical protein